MVVIKSCQSVRRKALAGSTKKNSVQHGEKIKTKECIVQRRVSPRLQNMPDDKKPYYGNDPKRSSRVHGDNINKKKSKLINPSRQEALAGKTCVGGGDGNVLNSTTNGGLLFDEQGKSIILRLKEMLRLYNMYYLQFVQVEENRKKEVENNNLRRAKRSKTNNVNAGDGDGDFKRTSKRPDLKALSKMKNSDKILYPQKRFGHLPGVPVGHQFFSRAEMAAVGFHSSWLSGIDYMGMSYANLKDYNSYSFPLAVAIVLSGQYEDDVDNHEEVVYTGQGGNDLLGNKRQVKDQEMTRGNLALKNNMEQSVPVRVVRGHGRADRHDRKVYTYDGLYKVVRYWTEKGIAGFRVYKYQLKRLQGQPNLVADKVHFARGQVSKVASGYPSLVCNDISNGEEDICIPVTNEYDDPPVAPAGFKYIKSIQVANKVNIPSSVPGCKCKGSCTNRRTCSCARLNGSEFPYVRHDGGRLIEARDVVFECGPRCGCGPDCGNRISQKGLKCRLEVYRTPKKGWAVRTWDFIPSGAPVCEYVGVLRTSDELDNVSENDYIFEIDCWQTMNSIEGRERRFRDVSLPTSSYLGSDDKIMESGPEFCIDAGSFGNVARFINHSCEPNLFVQCVLSSHRDVRLARVVLFAADNIAPYQELTYDYGYKLDSVTGPDGKIKQKPCYCSAADCRKRLY